MGKNLFFLWINTWSFDVEEVFPISCLLNGFLNTVQSLEHLVRWSEVSFLSIQPLWQTKCIQDATISFLEQLPIFSWRASINTVPDTSKVLQGGWVHKPGCDRLNVFRMPPAPRCSYWHFLGGFLSIRYRHLESPARWVGSCDRLNAFRMPPVPRCSYWHFLGELLSITKPPH